MAKSVTSEDIFGGMFQGIPGYSSDSRTVTKGEPMEEEDIVSKAGKKEAMVIKRSQLHPFRSHPFRVIEDEQMKELARSIQMYGIQEPILIRPDKEKIGEYEIISGHRRNHAAGLAGLEEVPVRIEELDDDDAAILMVDSNNKREALLPSEKAWAYRIKAEALRHQGKRKDLMPEEEAEKPDGMKAVSEKDGDSIRTIQRYIRLTYLNRELLELVDAGEMTVGIGYHLSFFNGIEQGYLTDYYREHQILPDKAQIAAMAEVRDRGKLDAAAVARIMSKREKAERPEKKNVILKDSRLKQYFPQDATKEYMENIILELLEQWSGRKGTDDLLKDQS